VAMEARQPIGAEMTAGELHDALMTVGANLMVDAMVRLEAGKLTLEPQPAEGVTYAAKIDKAETRIGWSRPASDLHNHVRGLSPAPGAWFEIPGVSAPERVKVLRCRPSSGSGTPGELLDDGLTVACGTGALRLTEVQKAGSKAMTAQDFQRGAKLEKGKILS
jgi:methionyl-tRNA formyltransferase